MAVSIDNTANIEAVRMKESAAPDTPASGYGKVYAKTDGKLYWKDDAGTETDLTDGGAGSDTDAIHDNVSAEISAVTEKTTPIAADLLLIEDSADSNNKKRVQLGNIPSATPSVCEGRLTLTTGTPITTSDVTAAGTIYFTPLNGNKIGLYDGTNWEIFAFSELSLSISGYTADKNYDIYIYDNSGTLTLESLIWTNDTTRGTALVAQDGILVKTGATTRRYIGTIRITDTTGQTEDSLSKRYVWNYNNRTVRPARVVESTNDWTYNTAAWRSANNSTTNRIQYVCGVSEDPVYCEVQGYVSSSAAGTVVGAVGVGIDSTSANSATLYTEGVAISSSTTRIPVQSRYIGYPGAGFHFVQWIEYARSGTVTFDGDGGLVTTQCGLMAALQG